MSYKLYIFKPQEEGYSDFLSIGNDKAVFIPDSATSMLAKKEGKTLARLTIQIRTDLHQAPSPCGLIGHYEAVNSEAARFILTQACKCLKSENISYVIGPMNGSTWERYRFALPNSFDGQLYHPQTFLGEPRNLPDYPDHFLESGFEPIDFYESRITDQLLCRKEQTERLLRKLERLNIHISTLDVGKYEEILKEIFLISLSAFKNNMFYTPIDFEQFQKLYTGIKPYLDPELVLLGRGKEGKLAGFVFGYPDLESVVAGRPERVIFKTLAVEESFRMSGLPIALLDQLHLTAYKKGYKSVIHALMHSDNNSLKLSLKCFNSLLFKRYVLYGKNL